MIPVSLTIKGLYSYQEETTIDFAHLTSAGLFGIFGAVGSGKSTILEAISFALYGETERLNSRDSRGYNMMNLKCSDLLIDFTFLSSTGDDKYRFTIACKRNRKKFDDTGSFDRKAYKWQNNSWAPVVADGAAIIGLSYENFKRTIIIPQGKFQEFLQLKDAERVQMLKEIFSLEKFELSFKTAKLTKENDLKVSNIEGQMISLPEYNEELLKEKETQLTLLKKELDNQHILLQQMVEKEKQFELLQGLFHDYNEKEKAYDLLQQKENEFSQIEQQVIEYEKCERTFKHRFENRNKIQASIKDLSANLKAQQDSATIIQTSVEQDESLLFQLNDAYQKKEMLLQQADEIDKIIKIKTLLQNKGTLEKRIAKGEVEVEKEKAKGEIAKAELEQLRELLSKVEEVKPDIAMLNAVNNWFLQKNQLLTNLHRTQKESEEAAGKLPRLNVAIKDALAEFPKELEFETMPENIDQIKKQTDSVMLVYEQRLQNFKEELAHLQLTKKLEEFSQALQPGDECPLCGSVHHPKKYSAENVDEQIKALKKETETIEQNKRNINSSLITVSSLFSDYSLNKQLAEQRTGLFNKAKAEADAHLSSFNYEGFTNDDEALITQAIKDYQLQTNRISTFRKQLDEKQKELNIITGNISNYTSAIEKLRQDAASLSGELTTLQSQIKHHDLTKELGVDVATLQQRNSDLRDKYGIITKQFETAEKRLQDNRKQSGVITGKIQEIVKQLSAADKELESIAAELNLLILQEGYNDEDAVTAVLKQSIDILEQNKKIQQFKHQQHTARVQKDEALQKVEGKAYDAEQHGLLKDELTAKSQQIKSWNEELIKQQNELEQLKEQMARRQALQQDLDKLIIRTENLKVLTNLFKAGGFVKYVSTVFLQNLINTANERFYKMTRQKLQLELTDENSFRVRDFLNNGEVRSIKTLSGGQTFQAALSLALALADNIQHLTKSKQNFFFLDEGFGSLDKESLAIVFDTLKNLKKENRIVGVISHVDEMQHQIPVNLQIINNIEKGSVVYTSWGS